VPPLYAFRIRSRVFRWYGQLREIEDRMLDGAHDPAQLTAELDQLEQRAGTVNVPLSYADELYALRNNIALVRSRVTATGT
jgi:phytoene/squalene synthetase